LMLLSVTYTGHVLKFESNCIILVVSRTVEVLLLVDVVIHYLH
jgi:hypothetical protein